ncbi:hypothetical protein [Microcoleus sp. herbarium12]|jgi:hypothetical protein|uniref:hypothetical protein n=1 Tax=Microcoleus sp. herbarium12 TaxID=3055437 RepID=UPI002FD0E45A
MSNPQNNPNSGQTTIIQKPGWKTKFKIATHWTKTLIIPMALFGGAVKTIEFFVNMSQVPQAICILTPLCPPEPPPPKWIGVKIEDVYIKDLRNYQLETTLFVSDKSPYEEQDKDFSVIKNVDQNLSRIGAGKKQNSGQYEAVLRIAKNNRKPLCLKIYGRRHYPTSEFKNIIDIKDFPDPKNYDSLTSEARDRECTPKTL